MINAQLGFNESGEPVATIELAELAQLQGQIERVEQAMERLPMEPFNESLQAHNERLQARVEELQARVEELQEEQQLHVEELERLKAELHDADARANLLASNWPGVDDDAGDDDDDELRQLKNEARQLGTLLVELRMTYRHEWSLLAATDLGRRINAAIGRLQAL